MVNSPIRILQCTGKMNRGGAETLVMNIYRHLDRSRVQFDFVSYTATACHYDAEIEELGGRMIHLPAPRAAGAMQAVADLARAMRTHGPYHAVHSHNMFHGALVMIAAKKCGIPCRVAHAHSSNESARRNLARMCYTALMRKLIVAYSTRCLACSNAAGTYVFGRQALAGAKYVQFPNAVDFSDYLHVTEDRFAIRRELGIPDQSPVIGHIGRFTRPKNHRFIIETFAELLKTVPEARLLLVGYGELLPAMQAYAAERAITEKVLFTGMRDDVARMTQAMDVFLFPSLYEGLGIALLEAQAAGLPCVTSDAIQPEADLGLGLLTALPLSRSLQDWCAAITRALASSRPPQSEIEQAIERSGMHIEATTRLLLEIYGLPVA